MPPLKIPATPEDSLTLGLEKLWGGDSAEGGLERLLSPRRGEVSALLEKYIAELELFNPAYGLVKVRNRDELVIKHILDSLAPLGPLLRELKPAGAGLRVADVGSGAGLPGIPLAIALPEARFTLIERMGRRAGFLRDASAVLGLGNVTVEEGELEKAEGGRFDAAVFRAFRPLEKPILKALLHLLAPGGCLAAWKGRRETTLAEMSAVERALPELAGRWEVLPLSVPLLEEERHLVIIRGDSPAGGSDLIRLKCLRRF